MTDQRAVANVHTKNEHPKFNYLRNLVKGEQEYSEFQSVLHRGAGVDVVQNVVSSDGELIQSIVWHDDIAEMQGNLNEYLTDKPTNASEDSCHERAKRDLERLVKLDTILTEQGLDFIFIEN